MAFPLTHETLVAIYEWLRTTKPFRAWKLPHADQVEFRVTAHRDRGAHFHGLDHSRPGPYKYPDISVSVNGIIHYSHLHEAMAHEMIHFYLDRNERDDNHGPNFQKASKSVCKYHGFLLKDFIDNGG